MLKSANAENKTLKAIKKFDNLVLITAIIICFIAFLIEGLKLIFKDILLQIDYSLISSIFLFSISSHFLIRTIIENHIIKQQESIEDFNKHLIKSLNEISCLSKSNIEISNKLLYEGYNNTKNIINSLSGVEIKYFENINDVDIYISKKILNAQKSVYDLNWQDYLASNPRYRNVVDKEYAENEIDKSIIKFCNPKNKLRLYKEIFSFTYPKNLAKMLKHVTYGDTYNCSYYDNTIENKKFPKLQFVVIDEIEVIFVSSAYIPNLCAINNKRIAQIFSTYFEQAWNLSIKIKEKNIIHENVIKDIKIRNNYVD